MQSSQIIAHLISQTRENINLLSTLNGIPPHDADLILSKLPTSESTDPGSRSNTTNKDFIFKARAIWGYNEDRREPQDLTFFAGDIIEIIDDKDANWWIGRNGNEEGTFPATYVEKFADQNERALRPVPPPPVKQFSRPPPVSQFQGSPINGPVYTAPMPPAQSYPYSTGPSQPYYAPPPPPPPPGPYPSYGPPQPQQPIIVQEEHHKKKGLFSGGLGNTLAQSAAGGVGFGAGSAAAGGIINAIF